MKDVILQAAMKIKLILILMVNHFERMVAETSFHQTLNSALKQCLYTRDNKILGWCPTVPVLPHWEKVPP